MPSQTHSKIPLIYLLIYIKFVYSKDDIPAEVTVPAHDKISQISIPFYINGKTAYHFDYFTKIFRFEHNWISLYDGKGEQTHVNVKMKHDSEDFECSSKLKVYTYTAKNNVLFNMVNSDPTGYDAEVIWAITGPVDYANKVVYDEADPNFLVVSIYHVNGKKTSFTKENGGEWKEFKITDSSNTLSQDKIEVRIESQYTTPALWIGNNDKYLKYTFYDGVKCVGVEYDRTQLLRTYDEYPRSPYPESVAFALKGNTAFVNFEDYMDILRLEGNMWRSIITGNPQPVRLSIRHAHSTDMFDYLKNGNVHTYTAKGLYLFSTVSRPLLFRSDEIIWQTDDLLEYATKIVYNTSSSNVLLIHHVNGSIRTFSTETDGIWHDTGLSFPKIKQIRDVKTPSDVPPPETEPPTPIPPPATYTPKAVEENEELQHAISNGINLENDGHLKHTFDSYTKCVGVDYDCKAISEPGSSDSYDSEAELVHFSIKGNTAFVNFEKSMVILRFENDDWKYVYYGRREAKSINLTETSSNGAFIYKKDDDLHTFTAIHGSFFCKVFINHDSSDQVIWNTLYLDDLCTKVEYHDSDPKNLLVTTYHINGIVRNFNKQSGGKWKETEANDSKGGLTPYKVGIRILSLTAIPGVRIEKDDDYLKYTFYDGVKCVAIEYDWAQILEVSANNIRYPDSVGFTRDGTTAFLTFKNSVDILRFYDNRWMSLYYGTGEGISMNVLFKKSCENYDSTIKGQVYTYNPKGGKLFNKIIRHQGGDGPEEVIFETNDVLDMAYEVVYDEMDPYSSIVSIYQVNGLGRKIQKCNFGLWTNESSFIISKHNLEKLNKAVTLPPKPNHAHEQQTVDSTHLRSS